MSYRDEVRAYRKPTWPYGLKQIRQQTQDNVRRQWNEKTDRLPAAPGEPGTTRVVHVLKHRHDVYIGRFNRRYLLPRSPWANPYKIGADGTREQVLELYRAWLLARPELIARAQRELKGRVLGCWCAPERCHGHVLIEVAGL
jgi:hypothetical protein